MPKVAIVTDSTSSIPDELINKYSIQVAPQVLIWGDEIFEDGVDIQPEEFYSRLENADVMPSTSQVTPKSFHSIFRGLLDKGYEILAVLVATPLSGTIASAVQVQEEMAGAPIKIVDSISVSMGLGFQVLEAAKAAAEGASLEECKAIAEISQGNTGIVFAVDTLEFLHRGGRIGGGSRFLGTALNLKPILEIIDGKIEAVERVRTRKKSLIRLTQLIEDRIDGREPLRIAVVHAKCSDEARVLLEKVQEKFPAEEYIFSEISPVLGTHAGPGLIGIAFLAGI